MQVHLEVAHNNIHYLVGGRHEFSMSTLEWTSYDPLFFLHHSNVDRIFAVWQELQRRRGKTYDHADCSVELFRKELEPFNRDSNPIALTKTFSQAKDLFRFAFRLGSSEYLCGVILFELALLVFCFFNGF